MIGNASIVLLILGVVLLIIILLIVSEVKKNNGGKVPKVTYGVTKVKMGMELIQKDYEDGAYYVTFRNKSSEVYKDIIIKGALLDDLDFDISKIKMFKNYVAIGEEITFQIETEEEFDVYSFLILHLGFGKSIFYKESYLSITFEK